MKPFPDAKCRKTSKSFVVALELPNFAAEFCKLTPKNDMQKCSQILQNWCLEASLLAGSLKKCHIQFISMQ